MVGCAARRTHFPADGTAKPPTSRLRGGSTIRAPSRFWRAGMASGKRFVAWARLVWDARLGEMPGLSVSATALRLDASSPQCFGRMVRTLTGLTAAEFQRRFDGAAMQERFRATLIEPYSETLRTFDPLSVGRS